MNTTIDTTDKISVNKALVEVNEKIRLLDDKIYGSNNKKNRLVLMAKRIQMCLERSELTDIYNLLK